MVLQAGDRGEHGRAQDQCAAGNRGGAAERLWLDQVDRPAVDGQTAGIALSLVSCRYPAPLLVTFPPPLMAPE